MSARKCSKYICLIVLRTLTLLNHLDVMRQIDIGQVFDDDVESFVSGKVHQLLLVRFVVVVENLMSSAFQHNVHAVLKLV
jgi:hypothetical protein